MSASTKQQRAAERAVLLAEVRESFGMAIDAIRAHKLRSCLTLLGILIGVFSIVVVMTAIRALQSNIEREISMLGAHTFLITRFPVIQTDNTDFEKYLRRKRITIDVARHLQARASEAKSVSVRTDFGVGEAQSKYATTNPNVMLMGATPETFETLNWVIEEGRPLMANDLDSERFVGVLGNNLAKKLFPRSSAVGENVRVMGINYQVIGVLETKGTSFGQDQDNFMAIPITTGLSREGRLRSVGIQVQAYSAETYDDTVEQVRGILRAYRKVPPGEEDDFEINSNDSIIRQFRSFTLAVRAGAGIISSIALVAAGIGIMNIMLVSVTERTREIGIRRAIGAKKRNIMIQFILEAIMLCEIGGVLGVVLGIAAGNLGAMFLKTPPVIPLDWALIGLVTCSIVGIVFGTYPAYKAANLDPIESLRYE